MRVHRFVRKWNCIRAFNILSGSVIFVLWVAPSTGFWSGLLLAPLTSKQNCVFVSFKSYWILAVLVEDLLSCENDVSYVIHDKTVRQNFQTANFSFTLWQRLVSFCCCVMGTLSLLERDRFTALVFWNYTQNLTWWFYFNERCSVRRRLQSSNPQQKMETDDSFLTARPATTTTSKLTIEDGSQNFTTRLPRTGCPCLVEFDHRDEAEGKGWGLSFRDCGDVRWGLSTWTTLITCVCVTSPRVLTIISYSCPTLWLYVNQW